MRFSGGYTIVRVCSEGDVAAAEMFVPLSHSPGHAQADFGEADGYIVILRRSVTPPRN